MAAMTQGWLVDIPTEIRLIVYKHYFKSTKVVNSRFTKIMHGVCSTAPLNLLLTSRSVKEEAEAVFWDLCLFWWRVRYRPSTFCQPINLSHPRYLTLSDHGVSRYSARSCEFLADFRLSHSQSRPPKYLSIANFFQVPYTFAGLYKTIVGSKEHVRHLQLNVASQGEPPYELKPNQATGGLCVKIRRLYLTHSFASRPFPYNFDRDDYQHSQLHIRDTFNVTILGKSEYLKTCVEDVLKFVHGEDFHKVNIVEEDVDFETEDWPQCYV